MFRFLALFLVSLIAAVVAVPRIIEYTYPLFEKAFLDPYEVSQHNNPEVALAFELVKRTPPQEMESLIGRLNLQFGKGTTARLISLDAAETEVHGPASRIEQLRQGVPLGKFVGIGQYEVGYMTFIRIPDENRVLQISFNPYANEIPDWQVIQAFFWVVRGAVVTIVVLLWAFPFWRALNRLRTTGADFAEGKLSSRVRLSPYSVLAPIAESFNGLAERAEKLILSHKALSGAVAHELRTPITRIRFAQRIGLESHSIQEKDAQLAKIGADALELEEMTNELLLHEKLYTQTHPFHLDVIDAKAFCDQILETSRQKAELQAPDVVIAAQCDVQNFCGDRALLRRAAQNLVDNAVRHARRRVHLTLQQSAGSWLIEVDDDGDGIPSGYTERVFEPFFQLDQSRSTAYSGAGLGLAIVKQIVRLHQGQVSVGVSKLGGAKFRISLPQTESCT